MLFQRISNLLPKYFGFNELYFIRYSSREPAKHLKEISKELHLSRNQVDLEYIISKQELHKDDHQILDAQHGPTLEQHRRQKEIVDAVMSKNEAGEDYLTLSLLRAMPELNNNANSVTIGFVLTDAVKKKINFLHTTRLCASKN